VTGIGRSGANSQAKRVSTQTQITAAVIGNALEWYDFTVYGTLTVTISGLFFPPGSGSTALLSTLAIFGVSYIVRPFGGLVFGHYADLIGRKNVLFVVIGLMTLGIAVIAFTPTYATIGIAAPFIMLIARIIQGFSVGGEFATSTAFLVEHAPRRHRYLYGSWQFAGPGRRRHAGGDRRNARHARVDPKPDRVLGLASALRCRSRDWAGRFPPSYQACGDAGIHQGKIVIAQPGFRIVWPESAA
jgi:hypothetical protein